MSESEVEQTAGDGGRAMPPLGADELRSYTVRRDGPGLFRLACHLAFLGLSGAVIVLAESVFVLAPALLAHGIVMTFLFAPLHESVHRTAFRTPALNRLAGLIGGAVLVLPPVFFRHFHIAHHRYTQDPERDPELKTPKPRSWAGYFLILSGFEYWHRSWGGLLRRAAGDAAFDFIPPPQRRRVVREARLFLGGYAIAFGASVALQNDWLLWLWIIPSLIGQPFLRAYLLAEHWGCPAVDDMWRNTRSTVSNRLVRLLAWNMPYHSEHHAYAGVPFHALPGFSDRMAEHRNVVSPSYSAFHRTDAPRLISRMRAE